MATFVDLHARHLPAAPVLRVFALEQPVFWRAPLADR